LRAMGALKLRLAPVTQSLLKMGVSAAAARSGARRAVARGRGTRRRHSAGWRVGKGPPRSGEVLVCRSPVGAKMGGFRNVIVKYKLRMGAEPTDYCRFGQFSWHLRHLERTAWEGPSRWTRAWGSARLCRSNHRLARRIHYQKETQAAARRQSKITKQNKKTDLSVCVGRDQACHATEYQEERKEKQKSHISWKTSCRLATCIRRLEAREQWATSLFCDVSSAGAL